MPFGSDHLVRFGCFGGVSWIRRRLASRTRPAPIKSNHPHLAGGESKKNEAENHQKSSSALFLKKQTKDAPGLAKESFKGKQSPPTKQKPQNEPKEKHKSKAEAHQIGGKQKEKLI